MKKNSALEASFIFNFVGRPGSGKGDRSTELGHSFMGFDVIRIDMGHRFRSLDPESEHAKVSKSFTCSGGIVPDHITNDLFARALEMHDLDMKLPNGVILVTDGLPRSVPQYLELMKIVRDSKRCKIVNIFLDATVECCRGRIKERAKKLGRLDDLDMNVVERRQVEFDAYFPGIKELMDLNIDKPLWINANKEKEEVGYQLSILLMQQVSGFIEEISYSLSPPDPELETAAAPRGPH